MKRVQLIISISILLLLSTFSRSADASSEAWEKVKDKNGITVFTRKVEGAKIKEFKATMIMDATVEQLIAIYSDPSLCTDWVPDCKNSKLTQQTSDKNLEFYREINTPWPFKNSDYVLAIEIGEQNSEGEVVVKFIDVKPALTSDDNTSDCCNRLGMKKGYWMFSPMENEQVLVTYQEHFHPGVKVPSSLINAAMIDIPLQALAGMNKLNISLQ